MSLINSIIPSFNRLPARHERSNAQKDFGPTVKPLYEIKENDDAFGVTVDYLVDETARPTFDRLTVKRLQEIEALSPDEKGHLMALMDAFLRDARTKKAYAS